MRILFFLDPALHHVLLGLTLDPLPFMDDKFDSKHDGFHPAPFWESTAAIEYSGTQFPKTYLIPRAGLPLPF